MADYYKKKLNVICEAYIRVDKPFSEFVDRQKSAEEALESYVGVRSKHFLYPGATIEIDFEDGSVVAKVTMYGSLLTLLSVGKLAIDFPSRTRNALHDARRLSASIINEEMYILDSRQADVVRSEARVGLLGAINDVNKILCNINEIQPVADFYDIFEYFSNSIYRIPRLLSRIKLDEDVKYVCSGFKEQFRLIPKTPVKNPKVEHSAKDVKKYREKLMELEKLLNENI